MNAPAPGPMVFLTATNRHERIDALADMEAGWYDGRGEVIGAGPIASAHLLIDLLTELGLALPGAFPTEDGGVLMEWANPMSVDSIEFEPNEKASCMTLDANDPDGFTYLETDVEGAFAFVRENRHLFTSKWPASSSDLSELSRQP